MISSSPVSVQSIPGSAGSRDGLLGAPNVSLQAGGAWGGGGDEQGHDRDRFARRGAGCQSRATVETELSIPTRATRASTSPPSRRHHHSPPSLSSHARRSRTLLRRNTITGSRGAAAAADSAAHLRIELSQKGEVSSGPQVCIPKEPCKRALRIDK